MRSFLSFLAPLILLSHLLFFFRCKIIFDIEGLSDFFWGLSFYHVSNSLAREVKKGFDIQVVGSQNELKEGSLIHLTKFLIPWNDVVCSFLIFLFIRNGGWVFIVIFTTDD